jgi:hypothetical protein
MGPLRLLPPALATALLLIVAPAAGAGVDFGRGVPAAQKVVQMLQDMAATAKKNKNDEEVSYAAYSTWCDDEKASLTQKIAQEAEELESLAAETAKLESDAKALGEEITSLTANVATYEADVKAKTAQRETEHKEFLATQQDYGESVDALERAVAVLKSRAVDIPASMLLQVQDSPQIPEDVKEVVAPLVELIDGMKEFAHSRPSLGFMQSQAHAEDPDNLAYSAPEADAYEFQSTSILQLLEKLRDDFVAKKTEVEKEEMTSKHAFEMLAADLADSIEAANENIAASTEAKASKEQTAAMLSEQATQTAAEKASDEKLLADTTTGCSQKKLSFEEKQHLREEEIQALSQAIEVLSSEAVQGAAEKHLALPQKSAGRAPALLQSFTRRGASAGGDADGNADAGIRKRILEFLAAQGKRLNSKNLELLAEKVANDPFVKVRKMIQEMITRLLDDANEEAEHKGFCDKEIAQSTLTRKKLTETMDGLTADIENGKATISLLTEDIGRLTADIAAIDSAVAKAVEMRTAEKSKNAATVKDAVEAQEAVQQAMAVLKDFYAKASTATALLQTKKAAAKQPAWGETGAVKMGSEEWQELANPNFEGVVDKGHKAGMQTFGETYSGQQEEVGGVLAMLEVIESDFGNLKAETDTSELESQKAHEAFMAESSKNKAVKSKKLQLNSEDVTATEAKIREDTSDLKFAQDKMLAADRYYEQLEPQCIHKGVSYEERKQSREEEISSLKEALAILSGEEI